MTKARIDEVKEKYIPSFTASPSNDTKNKSPLAKKLQMNEASLSNSQDFASPQKTGTFNSPLNKKNVAFEQHSTSV